VLALGPEGSTGLYEWAIVSDNLSFFLFVLARDVETFKAKYNNEVVDLMKKLGFKGVTAPIATYQESDCVYESASTSASVAVAALKNAPPETVESLNVDAVIIIFLTSTIFI